MSATVKRIKIDHPDAKDDYVPVKTSVVIGDGCITNPTIESLSVDVMAIILSYLGWDEILKARVCKKFREASLITPAYPGTKHRYPRYNLGTKHRFEVNSNANSIEALSQMARILPNLQQVSICSESVAFEDGEEPDVTYTRFAGRIHRRGHAIDVNSLNTIFPLPIHVLTRLQNLRGLSIGGACLNGYYPSLFEFRHLQFLHIQSMPVLKVNIDILVGCPVLEEFICHEVRLKGDIEGLRAIKNTLRVIHIADCPDPSVHGDIIELARFPVLEYLSLRGTSVGGDIREMDNGDFPVLKELELPENVNGSLDRAFDRVTEVPDVMNALCGLKKQNGTVFQGRGDMGEAWGLSDESPDSYGIDIFSLLKPPFSVQIVEAGPYIGWRWTNLNSGGACETNWVGQQPDKASDEYAECKDKMETIQADVRSFRGFFQPPTEEEYQRLSTHW